MQPRRGTGKTIVTYHKVMPLYERVLVIAAIAAAVAAVAPSTYTMGTSIEEVVQPAVKKPRPMRRGKGPPEWITEQEAKEFLSYVEPTEETAIVCFEEKKQKKEQRVFQHISLEQKEEAGKK
eukprot:Protomagalhaensia_sp_Gyna_25__4893@NODE_517_length_3227_cov_1050_430678_g406_i0_p3_GENE_NODE_517_length_3227_cov_1050_430678_g406_i0NODE_517_length_3227_cov_1050_430678_g406_i0_p3_ORF_typecomplete_len122_score33_25BAF1_ABF1/PF04684_13/0_017BAF1_ABF1/PF04684_13/6_6e03AAA_19/PF13245_6/0_19_NODE_517_length_3227_cov_1050_430678_g406_i019652330